ncbi:MAG: cytochrome P450 [Bauldia sp.]
MTGAPREFDPFALTGKTDRYAVFKQFRAEAPIARGAPPFPPTRRGVYLFASDLVEQALKHPALPHAPPGDYEAVRNEAAKNFAWGQMIRWMLLSDPPRHAQLRRPVAAWFSETTTRGLEGRLRESAAKLTAAAGSRGNFDVVREVVVPFVVHALDCFLGIEIADIEWFRKRTAHLAVVLDLRQEGGWDDANAAMRDLCTFAERELDRRSAPGEPRLVDAMLDLQRSGQWTRDEVVESTVLFLLTGQETIIDGLGNAIVALAQHPDQAEKLRAGLAVDGRVVDELLRFDAPVQFAGSRIAASDFALDGFAIAAGEPVTAVLASANRDETCFRNADELDLERTDGRRQLSFGSGAHHCIGQHLARLEMRVLLDALYCAMPRWTLDLDGVERRKNISWRGVVSAPARIG